MQEKEFNLLYEPWILVLNLSGETEEVSLLTALERAHEFRCLGGELPTQDVAVLRLLLATLYATFTRVDANGNQQPIQNAAEALERWQSLWERGQFPIEPIKKRLCHYEERFYLFHPERPFYQVAGLVEANGKYNPIAQIVSDIPSRAERRFLSTKSGENAETLTFEEAARWLISMQAWDYAGKKASIVGGSPNGGGTGWLGKIGVVYPASSTLFQTLMLNFVLLKSDGELLSYGSPTWEENQLSGAKKVERRPVGYCELLTWQSRRVLLFRGNEKGHKLVKGVLYSYGDVFQAQDMIIEQMSGWHLSGQKNSKGHFVPNKHKKERSFWRNLNSVLPRAANVSDGNYNPGVVQWLSLLKGQAILNESSIELCAVGFHYGAMDAKIEDMIADFLSINTGILSGIGHEWIVRIADILQLTEQCVVQLGHLATDLAKASGDSESAHRKAGEGISNAAKAEAYFRLDIPFRQWLAAIDPEQNDIDEAENDWINKMQRIILQIGEEITQQSGEKAITGRWTEVKIGNRQEKKLFTAPGAWAKFRSSIYYIIRKGGL